ncbi:hypothetical protein H4217_006467 [Coemansia sp. RSA 1939]|nr:hypothetical protein H4217_006467 [Coemansia sp. RSA 1939]KAJ2604659.1 hypothetical protein EV177_006346 [Coemansia sp. RSA 1804]
MAHQRRRYTGANAKTCEKKPLGQQGSGGGAKKRDTAVRISDDMAWSRAISHSDAVRLLGMYDAKVAETLASSKEGAAAHDDDKGTIGEEDTAYVGLLTPSDWEISRVAESAQTNQQADASSRQKAALGRHMPSSVMHRLDMEFHADVKQRRQHHGLRIRVLAALSDLRHTIEKSEGFRDTSGQVYIDLERLEQLYMDWLRSGSKNNNKTNNSSSIGPRPLELRSGNSMTIETGGTAATKRHVLVVVTHDCPGPQLARTPTPFRDNDPAAATFERAVFLKTKTRRRTARVAESIDPRRACWIDYLVADLAEADAHALFRVVSRSKVPRETAAVYRTAAEEALVFAFNRRGLALEALETLRACMYFIRQWDAVAQKTVLCDLWRHAGRLCEERLVERAADELCFKRWNNVASGLVAASSKTGDVYTAWAVVGEWHGVWTRAMQTLCPVRRRAFADGIDPHAYPYWRPKAPDRLRLHELTLGSAAVATMMLALCKAGHVVSAAELLGLAASEIGVPVLPSMFTILLRGLAEAAVAVNDDPTLDDLRGKRPPELPPLVWVNANARTLYTPATADDSDAHGSGLFMATAAMRGMSRWRITPDAYALDALVRYACATHNARLLKSVVQHFASIWHITPTERCWVRLRACGLDDDVCMWIHAAKTDGDDEHSQQ